MITHGVYKSIAPSAFRNVLSFLKLKGYAAFLPATEVGGYNTVPSIHPGLVSGTQDYARSLGVIDVTYSARNSAKMNGDPE